MTVWKTSPQKNKTVSIIYVSPAEAIKLGLPEEVVAVVADTVEAREDCGVVHALALQVEEGAARDVVRGGRGRR